MGVELKHHYKESGLHIPTIVAWGELWVQQENLRYLSVCIMIKHVHVLSIIDKAYLPIPSLYSASLNSELGLSMET